MFIVPEGQGKNVNLTESRVSFTQILKGVIDSCQERKSQIKNREAAMNMINPKFDSY